MDVLFCGAGLSAALGYPITSEIFPKLLENLRSEHLFSGMGKDGVELRQRLADGLQLLMPGFAKGAGNLSPITEVLSLLDHLIGTSEAVGTRTLPAHAAELRNLIVAGILEVLKKPLDSERADANRGLFDKLAKWTCEQGQENKPICVVTTNYDLAFETAIYRRLWSNTKSLYQVDYGFPWRDPGDGEVIGRPLKPRLAFLKLHGSLNWLRCRQCGFIYINHLGSIAGLALQTRVDWENECHCGYGPLISVVVAPSALRRVEEIDLHLTWRSALEYLRQAQRWTFLGYSLPHEDVQIRALLLRAFNGRDTEPRVSVYQRSEESRSRFLMLFPSLVFSIGGVEEFIGGLGE